MRAFLRFLALGFALVATVAGPASAHSGRHGDRTVERPALLAAIVALGGGPHHFRAATLRQALEGVSPGEAGALRAAVGAPMIARFDATFTFVIDDALDAMKRAGRTLPAPFPSTPKAVAAALYQAALDDGEFDVEHLFDTLFSRMIHDHAMVAVARTYGAAGETAYHVVFGRLVRDLGTAP